MPADSLVRHTVKLDLKPYIFVLGQGIFFLYYFYLINLNLLGKKPCRNTLSDAAAYFVLKLISNKIKIRKRGNCFIAANKYPL